MTPAAASATHLGAGSELLGVLVAGSLDEVRAMLPVGLTWRERASVDPPEMLEMWD